MKRRIYVCLCLVLLAGVLMMPTLAVEPPMAVTLEEPEKSAPEAAEAEEDADAAESVEADAEESAEADSEAESAKSAVAEPAESQAVSADNAAADDPQCWVMNHADPYATAFLLAASGASHDDFTTRALQDETLYLGIDVSEFQGTIDWAAVAADGIDFVIIRAAYRGVSTGTLGTDRSFVTNITGALAAGLEVGVYVYSQAITEEEGREEAQYLIDLVSGYDITLPLVIDYEYYSGSSGLGGRLYNANLSRQEATDICNAFCDAVEAAGYDSMVYANASMLNSSLYADQLGRVWLAHYTKETSYSGDYEYWQCSSSGAVDGISTLVDLNFWFKPNGFSSSWAGGSDSGSSGTEDSGSGSSGTTTSSPFTDVEEDDWYYSVVIEAYNGGVVKGITSTTFCPNNTATRGQVVTMIYRMMGEPEATGTTAFTDLTQDYYKDAVSWAAANQVVQGVSETSFAPNNTITRQDLVTMLYRLAGSPSVSGSLSAYTDGSSVRSYAQDAMVWAVEKGIIQGYSADNTLRPANAATRAEVCAILVRYLAL
ncbi:MAG: S-layer homology domain-containing protein [Oscillospiraceae bacterium]|nr:S-layer homology domain-containing protein [Oscillospiraceae bacterium]